MRIKKRGHRFAEWGSNLDTVEVRIWYEVKQNTAYEIIKVHFL